MISTSNNRVLITNFKLIEMCIKSSSKEGSASRGIGSLSFLSEEGGGELLGSLEHFINTHHLTPIAFHLFKPTPP